MGISVHLVSLACGFFLVAQDVQEQEFQEDKSQCASTY